MQEGVASLGSGDPDGGRARTNAGPGAHKFSQGAPLQLRALPQRGDCTDSERTRGRHRRRDLFTARRRAAHRYAFQFYQSLPHPARRGEEALEPLERSAAPARRRLSPGPPLSLEGALQGPRCVRHVVR